ncbi:MAG: DUF1611 domain-containing protein [Rhodothermales bacterium]|nr:DUF1611 domain-containing protein [Rhodothermales bacterium]
MTPAASPPAPQPEGVAVVYCDGAFNTPNGKTAHGLVRFTERYRTGAVVDGRYAGQDAGAVLDDRPAGIPLVASLEAALETVPATTHFVIGLAPDGGRLPDEARRVVADALRRGLHVDSGLHDFLSDDPELAQLAERHGAEIRDVRKPPSREHLHFFSGKIEEVEALKVAVLGTDSAVGKRTTAWKLVHALRDRGVSAELVGTGQTAWMQGARYSLVLDSVVSDFVAGEIEHAVWRAWTEARPDVIVLEGQGSLMNPAYPGGFELLAAGRPNAVVLQHAPTRKEYDGFPGYPLHPLPQQIQAVELIGGTPVVALTVNHEGLTKDEVPAVCRGLELALGLPTLDPLLDGADRLVDVLEPLLAAQQTA